MDKDMPIGDDEKPPSIKLLSNGANFPGKIGIIYSDVRREYFPTEEQYITEKDAEIEARIIANIIKKMGIDVDIYPGNQLLAKRLRINKPDLTINLVASVKGKEYLSATIPGLLELLEIPYTGAGIMGSSIAFNKYYLQESLKQNGIPVPQHQLFTDYHETLETELRFPLISKLNEIHGGVEINQYAVSENERQLRERLKFLISTYQQPILVEEFIVGREITAILLEGVNKKVYLAEKIFSNNRDGYVFTTFDDNWNDKGYESFHYRKYNDQNLKEYVKKAFDIAKMDDYGKFDIRIDASGRYYFLDSNCNPSFGPKELDIALGKILDLYGVSFVEVLKRLIENTVREADMKKDYPSNNIPTTPMLQY